MSCWPRIRTALAEQPLRVVHRLTVEEAEPLLVHGLATVCIVDVDAGGVQGTWLVERVLRRAPGCRVIVYAGERSPEWEEEVYLLGVRHVLAKPVRARLLARVLAGLEPAEHPANASARMPEPVAAPSHDTTPPWAAPENPALNALRSFSEILTHSLDAEALVRRFLHLVRERMGVNRAAVLLPAGSHTPGEHSSDIPRQMRPVCAIGLAPALASQVELSLDGGIAAFLERTGRVLRRGSRDAADPLIQREFDVTGTEVALPITGRDVLMGVVLLDCRVTGEPLSNGELETVFRLLEQVGMALANIRLHDQLVASNRLLGDVLRELASGCVVVGADLSIVHFNRSARRALGAGSARRSGAFEFGDLPEQLGGKIYQVLRTGAALPSFRHEPTDDSGRVFDVSIVPIHGATGSACSALMVMEDRTQAEHLGKLEQEAERLRLVRKMADRLAAEIGNAITPVSAYQQLLTERLGKKPDEFLATLSSAMADMVKRVARLLNQMRYIYRDEGATHKPVELGTLLDEAFKDARQYHAGKSARLVCDDQVRSARVVAEPEALRYALSEILLNGLQAGSQNPLIEVQMTGESQNNGCREIGLEIRDTGAGFSSEALKRAFEPFFTEKSVGVGLGLTAAKRITDAQQGRMELKAGPKGIVRMALPLEPPEA